MAIYVLYNPKAGNGRGEETAKKLKELYPNDELFFRNVTEMGNMPGFLDALGSEDRVILCGGDGTLNHFVNDLDGYVPQNEVLFYAAGTGNDFLNSLNKPADSAPFAINEFLSKLPTVTVNDRTYRFINGIGFGIDGYCCEVGDELREKSDKPINYTGIAIKGLLFHYKPTSATVIVDGQEKKYEKVWLAPTMNGRMYGGGMIPTPAQDRLKNETVRALEDAEADAFAAELLVPAEALKNFCTVKEAADALWVSESAVRRRMRDTGVLPAMRTCPRCGFGRIPPAAGFCRMCGACVQPVPRPPEEPEVPFLPPLPRECPVCGETELGSVGGECLNCGNPKRNRCMPEYNQPPHRCPDDARFCELCGAPTVYGELFLPPYSSFCSSTL